MSETHDAIAQSKQDHELLIRIDEQLKSLSLRVTSFGENLGPRVANLETGKMDKAGAEKAIDDFEARFSSLEMWRWMTVGGLSIISMLVIPLIIYIFTTQTSIDGRISQGVDDGFRKALEGYAVDNK